MKIFNEHRSDTGLVLFGVATIAFGIENFIYGDFVMGRAPAWPADLDGKLIWAYASGAGLIFSGIAMITRLNGWVATISLAAMLLVWALARHIFMGHFNWGQEITQTGKAWTLFGGALVMSTFMPGPLSSSKEKILVVGQCCLAAFFILSGIEHFMFAKFVVQLVPAWIPGGMFWTYFAAVALIAGGLGLLIPKTTRLAGMLSGIMVFTWFLILHIPRAIESGNNQNEWVAVFEALAFSGIALAISGSKK